MTTTMTISVTTDMLGMVKYYLDYLATAHLTWTINNDNLLLVIKTMFYSSHHVDNVYIHLLYRECPTKLDMPFCVTIHVLMNIFQ